MLTAYAYTLACYFLVMIVSGCLALTTLFRAKTRQEINRCVNGTDDDELTMNVCENGLAIYKGTGVAIYLVVWVVLACTCLLKTVDASTEVAAADTCILVASYVANLRQIKEERNLKPAMVKGMPIGPPEPLTMFNSAGAPGVNNGYAFSRVPRDNEVQFVGAGVAV